MTPQEYVEENWETFNQGGGNSVEDMARLIAAWDSAELRRQSQELERAREALRNMVAAYDLADEQGMFSDHGENHEAGMSCPGCLCDIASEECREALAALTQPAPEKSNG